MEWTDWLSGYYYRNTEEYFRNALQENGLPGRIAAEKTVVGELEYNQYRYLCGEKGILFSGICFEDLKKLCESSEKDVEPKELINVLCGEWAEEYHFIKDNRERLFQKEITRYLFPVLMNTKLNGRMLEEMPHVDRGGFSIVLHLGIPTEGKNGQSVLVSNQMMEAWGIGMEKALDIAIHNPWFVDQCAVISSVEMTRKMNQQAAKEWGGMFQIVEPEEEKEFMAYGKYVPCAAIVLNEEFTEKIHTRMGGDFLVAFFGTGEVQMYQDQGDIEDLQLDIEVRNELFGLSWNMVSDQVFRYTKERGLEPAFGGADREVKKQGLNEPVPRR